MSEVFENKSNSFELFGFDFMIDENLKCWLIEVNKCPCMAYSTHVTKTLIPLFMEDLAKVIVDKINDPNCDTGDLE